MKPNNQKLTQNPGNRMQQNEKLTIYKIEDKPGQGIYKCFRCFSIVKLGDGETLPVCGNCDRGDKTKYIKTELTL